MAAGFEGGQEAALGGDDGAQGGVVDGADGGQGVGVRGATLDGEGTLGGGGQRRPLYMNPCDEARVCPPAHCQAQDPPRLTLQNLTFADGNSTGDATEGGGGGAVFVRGGRVKVVTSRFLRNRCDGTGPDLGGAALRVLSQSQGRPVYVTQSTFGGAPGVGGECSNGGCPTMTGAVGGRPTSWPPPPSPRRCGSHPARGPGTRPRPRAGGRVGRAAGRAR